MSPWDEAELFLGIAETSEELGGCGQAVPEMGEPHHAVGYKFWVLPWISGGYELKNQFKKSLIGPALSCQ